MTDGVLIDTKVKKQQELRFRDIVLALRDFPTKKLEGLPLELKDSLSEVLYEIKRSDLADLSGKEIADQLEENYPQEENIKQYADELAATIAEANEVIKTESKSLNQQDLKGLLEDLEKAENQVDERKIKVLAEKYNVGEMAVKEWVARQKEIGAKLKESLEHTSLGKKIASGTSIDIVTKVASEISLTSAKIAYENNVSTEAVVGVLTKISGDNILAGFQGLPTQTEFESAVAGVKRRLGVVLQPTVLDEIAAQSVLLTASTAGTVLAEEVTMGVARDLEIKPNPILVEVTHEYVTGIKNRETYVREIAKIAPNIDSEKVNTTVAMVEQRVKEYKSSTLGVVEQASAVARITSDRKNFVGGGQNTISIEERVVRLTERVAHTSMANSIIANRESLGNEGAALRAAGLLGVANLNEKDLWVANETLGGFRKVGGKANEFMLGIMDGVDAFNNPETRSDFARLQALQSGLNQGGWLKDVGEWGLKKATGKIWVRIGGEKVVNSVVTGIAEKIGVKQLLASVATKTVVKTATGAVVGKVASGLLGKIATALGVNVIPGLGQILSILNIASIAKDILGLVGNGLKKIKADDMLAAVGAFGLAAIGGLVAVFGAAFAAITASSIFLAPIIIGVVGYLFLTGNASNNHFASILPPNQQAIIERSPKLAKQASLYGVAPNNGVRPTDLAADCPWGWPVSNPFVVSQGPYGGYSHGTIEAIDIFGSGGDIAGAPIFATHGGTVQAGGSEGNSYGYYVDVVGTCGGSPVTTRYAHMPAIEVTSGTVVRAGEVIGHADNSGTFRSVNSVAHLHYEVIYQTFPINKFLPKAIPLRCFWNCNVTGP